MRPPNSSPLKRVNLPWQVVCSHCMWDTSDSAVRSLPGAIAWRFTVTDTDMHSVFHPSVHAIASQVSDLK